MESHTERVRVSGDPSRAPWFCDVITPGPWWNLLTYELPSPPLRGARLKIPMGRGGRYGIVDSFSPDAPGGDFKIRRALCSGDDGPLVSGKDLDLIKWAGETFLCGAGEILKMAVPPLLLSAPEPLSGSYFAGEDAPETPGEYSENFLYDCSSTARWEKLVESVDNGRPFLVLFPEQALAASFYEALPPSLKGGCLLWPSTGGRKLADAWLSVREGGIKGIVGPPGAVFAPLPGVASLIVDEESSGAYRTYRRPFVNVRTIAARKAVLQGARLTLSGRLPSSRVYVRGRPRCDCRPPREGIKFVDLKQSFSPEYRGMNDTLRLSAPLFKETARTISAGRVALWLLDRKGYAGEVACEDCGSPLLCSSCGRIMAWRDEKGVMQCVACGETRPLPDVCPSCRGALLRGRRPGLEALFPVARASVADDRPVLVWDGARSWGKKELQMIMKDLQGGGLVLGTRSSLALCDRADVGFAAWIDADSEVRSVAFQAKFTAFSMVWESCWRGNTGEDRVVLLQSRRPGSGWQRGLLMGWERFWDEELRERKELGLPPYSFLIEITTSSDSIKDSIMTKLETAGLTVLDPGDPPGAVWVEAPSPGKVRKVLDPYFLIKNSRAGFPEITVWID